MTRKLIYGSCLLVSLAWVGAAFGGDKLQYNRDVRPILAENCFKCHGPDSAARKGDLRLDVRDAALKSEAFVPGKPGESKLIERIHTTEETALMPPPKSLKKLSPHQKDVLKRWIADGAEYELHWSLITPKRPDVPAVKNAAWPRNPIDNFVLKELEARGLQPAPEADRYTLARRLSLDLIGLPPKPAEVEAFVHDKSPDAYERYVDRVMASPHWGEHRGRYWLDVARYADTHGIHFDNYREMWSYRDWVVDAFNRNMPFDQFTIEQLAGDLLPNPTMEQRTASGFNRCNITTNEGGAINEEYLVLYARDRTETAAQTWLGLTAGCAVCHDHKFDPISQKEFYQLSAFFNNTTQAAMDGNVKDTPPTIVVPQMEDRARWMALKEQSADVKQQIEKRRSDARPEFEKWLAQLKASTLLGKLPKDGLKFHAILGEGAPNNVSVVLDGQQRQFNFEKPVTWQPGEISEKAFQVSADNVVELDEAGDFEKDKGFSFGAWVWLPHNRINGAFFARMDESETFRGWDLWIEGNRVGSHVISHWPDDAIKAVTANPIPTKKWTHVFVTYDGSSKVAGLKIYVNGVLQEARNVQADALKSSIKSKVPFKIGQRHNSSNVNGTLLQDVRLYDRTLSANEVEQLARMTRTAWLASKPAAKRTDSDKNEMFEGWLPANDVTYQGLRNHQAALQQEENAIKGRGTVALVSQEKSEAAMAYVLYRGDYDKRRDQVKPMTPAVFPPFPEELPRNRLGLAQWLLRPDHPLTSRVTVNRFWQELFGTGLVKTSGDFGIAGELPSHPELLDWLAVEFREGNWDVKRFFKLLVNSATYRQSAVTTPEKREKDPQDRWFSRGPRFRMDAEMIRDYALASSGILVPRIGGPSVKPYQPDGVWEAVAMIGSDTRDYRRDTGPNLYRRSAYTLWKRAAPPASMEILNAPNRETCCVRRERTDTPLQALVTLNDPQFVEAARFLAQRALTESAPNPIARLDFIARNLLARPFRPEEIPVVQKSVDELLAYYKGQPDDAKKLIAVGESKADDKLDPSELAAWTMLVNQLMNLDEVLCK